MTLLGLRQMESAVRLSFPPASVRRFRPPSRRPSAASAGKSTRETMSTEGSSEPAGPEGVLSARARVCSVCVCVVSAAIVAAAV